MENPNGAGGDNAPPIKPPNSEVEPHVDPNTSPVELKHKIDPLTKLETELKTLGGTVGKLKPFFNIQPAIAVQDSFDDIPEIESQQPEKPLTASELKKRIAELPQLLRAQANILDDSTRRVTDDNVRQARELSRLPHSQAVSQSDMVLTAATADIEAANAAINQETELWYEFNRLKNAYERTLLAEANAALGTQYQTTGDIYEDMGRKSGNIHNLGRQRLWTGKLFNRDKIRQLTRESQTLADFQHELHETIHGTRYYIPGRNKPEEEFNRAKVDIGDPVFWVILDRYGEIDQEFQAYSPTSEAPIISEVIMDSLNSDFIDKFFIPYVNRHSKDVPEERAVQLQDPENIQKAVGIIRESFKIRHNHDFRTEYDYSPEENEKSAELAQRLEQLPPGFREVFTYFFRFRPSSSMLSEYQELTDLVCAAQFHSRENSFIDSQKEFLGDFEDAISGENVPEQIRSNVGWISERKDGLDGYKTKIEQFSENFLMYNDPRLWVNFKNNPHILQLFGDELLNSANQYIIVSAIKKILAPTGTSDYQTYGEKLAYLISSEQSSTEEASPFHYPDTIFQAFAFIQKESGEIPTNLSSLLMKHLRANDPLLRERNQTHAPKESYDLFHLGLNRILIEASKPETSKDLFINEHILKFIARQPERIDEVVNLPTSVPYLFSVLMKEGGPLYTNRAKIIENIFANGDALRRAKDIESIFSQKVPYYKQLYLFTDARIGEALATANSSYPITEVTNISIQALVERHIAEKQRNPGSVTRLQTMISNPEVVNSLVAGEMASIPFYEFSGMYKRLIFRDLLRKSIETSRDASFKAQADTRNRLLSSTTFTIPGGTYIHGSAVDVTESVLLNGNLPQEALGEGAGTDSYPFQTDFSCLTDGFISEQANIEDIFNKSISGGYGTGGTLGREGQLFYLYRRTPDSYEGNKYYGPNERHALILGGMPATEISGIVLRNPDATLETVKKAVFENGFYIPVYDLEGQLLFKPEDYDALRKDLNLSVPIEVLDYSLKTGEQLGSNPGGEFTVPTNEDPVRYYVKFASSEGTEQIWNEQLADNIYRHLGIPVPDTKIVKMDTSYGHASRILPADEAVVTSELKNGFLPDALLANWDIVANSGNTISSGGRLIRIDNGGSLLFRARGERKAGFGGVVTELESMRTSYSGLTGEDVQAQLATLRERFTDTAIDQLVDSVRLSTKDRDLLKGVLRQRRDYILSYYNSETQTEEVVAISEERKLAEASLKSEAIDDPTISQLVPEWTKIIGEEGYQHNGVLLGEHIKSAIASLKFLPEYWPLSEREKNLALVATLFHDMGKPTGRQGGDVPRDYEHEIPSAQLAAEYMRKWGYSHGDIRTVVQIIINDGVASDIARSKVRDERKNLSPQQLREVINNPSALRILRAVNRADVIATVGAEGFSGIENAYNQYFEQAISA